MLRTVTSISLLLLGGLCGCDRGGPPAPAPGVVMLLDGTPVLASEVDRVAAELAKLRPTFSQPQLRRDALVSVVLPALYALEGNEQARAEALERAREFRAEMLSATEASELPPTIEIDWQGMGMDVWFRVQELDAGDWSEPLEIPGGFVVARIFERDRSERPHLERFRMNLEIFPWVPTRGSLITEMRAAQLEIVDPAWRDVVPASFRYAMDGGKS